MQRVRAWLMAALLGPVGFDVLAAPAPPVPRERERPWRIASFAQDAGLTRRTIFDVAFQADSTAWFAVSDGLYRYDGYTWRRFTAAHGLPSSFVRSVTVTREGSLWVSTDKGVGVYDGSTFDRRGSTQALARPGVHSMLEGPDGALWFCCDRWPDASVRGGLTVLREGRWTTFKPSDGLPSDNVYSVFCPPGRPEIVLTDAGAAVREGEQWRSPAEEHWPSNERAERMAETPDGLVFAEGKEATLVRENGRWRPCREGTTSESAPFCVTRDGAVIRAASDSKAGRVWFARWNGTEFEAASDSVAVREVDFRAVRQAPDGSIWAVGRGTVLRWEYLPGLWSYEPDLPPLRMLDRHQRLWFANQLGAVVHDGTNSVRVPEMRPPLVEDGADGVWSAADGGVAHWTPRGVRVIPAALSGIESVRGGVSDVDGQPWFYGQGKDGKSVVVHPDGEQWTGFGSETMGGLDPISMAADPKGGLWLTLVDENATRYEIARVSKAGLEIVPLEAPAPPTHQPSVFVDDTRLYLYAYDGLWEAPLTEPLRFTPADTTNRYGFCQAVGREGVVAFLAHEGFEGNSCLLIRRGPTWIEQRLEYGEHAWLGPDGWLLAANGWEFLLWHLTEWAGPAYVALPLETTITSLVRRKDGNYWVGTSDGLLCLHPEPVPPETLLAGPDRIWSRQTIRADVAGVSRYRPRSHLVRHSYAWRLDAGPWSDYADWPSQGIRSDGLDRGAHVLEVRARDGLGNEDPTPAALRFQVLPVPLQDRAWFRPALGSLALVLAGMAIALARSRQFLKRYAGSLETEVRARTAELREDIARREKAEESRAAMEAKLLEGQKLEAIGTLAGGIAHDFNNLLSVILPRAHLARIDTHNDPSLEENLDAILTAAERARLLVRQILTFSRPATLERRPTPLHSVLLEALRMLRATLPASIDITSRIDEAPPVLANATQIHQVLVNLCTNAEHAMRGRPGRLTVTYGVAPSDPAQLPADLSLGRWNVLVVTDTGHGMDKETLKRIFDPFFTTKPTGEGTGLGLAVVHGIVRSHHGTIHVTSKPGHETTFSIYLPTCSAPVESKPPAPPDRPAGRGERILFVDDEEGLCTVAQRILNRHGYHVTIHTDPVQALADFQARPHDFDLVCSDLTMPGLSGTDFAQQVRSVRHDLPILMATGYGGALTPDALRSAGVDDLLSKPLSSEVLTQAVHRALRNPTRTAGRSTATDATAS